MSVIYTAKASAFGGRAGTAKSDDGNLEVTLTVPKEMGGDGAPGTNPEQLFAAGYSACFLGALKAVARQEKVKLSEDVVISATVDFKKRDGGYEVIPTIFVDAGDMERSVVEDLTAKAHQVCPYSHAMRSSLEVEVKIV